MTSASELRSPGVDLREPPGRGTCDLYGLICRLWPELNQKTPISEIVSRILASNTTSTSLMPYPAMFGTHRNARSSRGVVIMSDLEVEAIAAISNTFSPLDAETRSRVLRWAVEKFGISAPMVSTPAGTGTTGRPTLEAARTGPQVVAEITDAPHTVIRSTVLPPTYEHLAELFDAVAPGTVMDKALAAAYWVQIIQGQDSWPSATLNKGLKDMGHAIPAIHKALATAMSRRPSLVIQLKKTGAAQQGRKVYKLTTEGVKYVHARIEGER
jgi:hypothetical protein